MTTTTGALIRSTDFDDLQSFLSRILGDQVTNYPNDPIAATYGYGQTLLSGQVTSVVDEVKAVQIAKLKSDIIKVATHCGLQNDSHITNLPTINQHDIILASHLQAYQSCLNFLSTNRFLLGSGQYSDELLSPDLSNNRVLPWGNNSSYKSAQLYGGETVRHAFTIDFRNPQAARYFFNSGSSLRLSASRTGGRVSQQNLSWTRTLNNMGTIIFDHSSCTSSNSVGSGSSIGFYQLTNNAQTVFTMAGDSTYSSHYSVNHYYVTMSCDIENNSNGGASKIYVTIYFDDAHSSKVTHYYHKDWVDGTLTSNVSIRRASGSNVNVVAPTGFNTRILTNI